MHYVNAVIVLCTVSLYVQVQGINKDKWKANWFPASPDHPDTNPVIKESELSSLNSDEPLPSEIRDDKHGIKMGVSTSYCDDGKSNLTTDWDGSPLDYTCLEPKTFNKNYDINPIEHCDNIPKGYWATHVCMNESIRYNDLIPTFGTHRPLWPKYGEYKYVPKQRWLHNLEHGAIVMLYHPCADQREISKLKRIVNKCLYRHIITPYNSLTPERPLALLSWGCRLTMNIVERDIVTEFIQEHALKGPETVSRDGQYNLELIHPAELITNRNDEKLCPSWQLIRDKRSEVFE